MFSGNRLDSVQESKEPLPVFKVTQFPSRQYTSRFKLAGPGDQWSEPLEIKCVSKDVPEISCPSFPVKKVDADSYFQNQNSSYDPRNSKPMTDPRFSGAKYQRDTIRQSTYYSHISNMVPQSAYRNSEYPIGYTSRMFPTVAETRLAMSMNDQIRCTCQAEECTCVEIPSSFVHGQMVRDVLSNTEFMKIRKKTQFAGSYGNAVSMRTPVSLSGYITGNVLNPVEKLSTKDIGSSRMENAQRSLNLTPATLGRDDLFSTHNPMRTFVSTKSPHYDTLLVRSTYRPPKFSTFNGKYSTSPESFPYSYAAETFEGHLERALRTGDLVKLNELAIAAGVKSFEEWSTTALMNQSQNNTVPQNQQNIQSQSSGIPPNAMHVSLDNQRESPVAQNMMGNAGVGVRRNSHGHNAMIPGV